MDHRSKIAILGFGAEGKAMLKYLKRHNFSDITVCDQNVDLKAELPDGISAQLGEEYLDGLENFDVIFRSPGVRWLEAQVQLAVNSGVEVTSGTAYFLDQCPCPVIGVTGTKGKGTTSTLIYEMLKNAGFTAYLGGNIGDPAINFLDDLKPDDVAVLELSSFQLHDLKKSPRYAVLLNTTSDHLDYHADQGEYLAAKEAILSHQNENSVAVLNRDYEYVKHYRPLVKGKLCEVSVKDEVKDGAFAKGGEIFWAKDGEKHEIMKVEEVALIGAHNLENVLPAVVIGRELGVSIENIKLSIEQFKGLPHRLEFVRELNGVRYFNDSFSTTPETSMAAVDSFDVPTVLIAGGADKGLDYKEWALKILTKPSLHTVVLIGKIAKKMEESLKEAEKKLGEAEGSPTQVLRRDSLKEAVMAAKEKAENKGGDGVVVMSPASSSFDMFANYKERGKQFMDIVRKLGA